MIDFDRLHRIIKETLTPTDYQTWKQAMDDYEENKQQCLVDAFFRHQETLPPSQRSSACMISCPCRKCSPGGL